MGCSMSQHLSGRLPHWDDLAYPSNMGTESYRPPSEPFTERQPCKPRRVEVRSPRRGRWEPATLTGWAQRNDDPEAGWWGWVQHDGSSMCGYYRHDWIRPVP